MTICEALLCPGGRMNRSEYWLKGVLPLLPLNILANVLYAVGKNGLGVLVTLMLLWPYFALASKRLHDRNRSAWFYLLVFVPFVNLWVAAEVLLLRGTPGPNRFETCTGLSGFKAVFKRELKSYFATPLAYVFLVIFLFFAGYLAFNKQGFYEARQADMQAFFVNLPLLFIFMVPATAMRLWAEERKVGSIELLFTLPITIPQAVIGKFLAAWTFLGIALALTFPMAITVAYLGDPDGGLIATGYLASFLMAGGFLAIGSFFSAVSKNQVIAFVLSVVACGVLVYAGMPTTLNYLSTFLPAGLVAAVEGMSFQAHFESLQRGIVQFKDLAYFVILIVGWIAACSVVLDDRKAQ